MTEKVSKAVWGVDSDRMQLGQLKSFPGEGGHRCESSEAWLPARPWDPAAWRGKQLAGE
jgi:hypothetical protein